MSWIQFAKIGDKVTRLPDDEVPEDDDDDYEDVVYPEYGVVYTIRDIVILADGGVGIRFFEIVNPIHEYEDSDGSVVEEETTFDATCFRPVSDRTTDISWAHDILRKATKPVEEHA